MKSFIRSYGIVIILVAMFVTMYASVSMISDSC